MPIRTSGQSFSITAETLKTKLSARNIGEVAVRELKATAKDNNWHRFENAIYQQSIDANTEMISISNDNNSKQIAGFLNFGTPAHGSVKAKALKFMPKGSASVIFRKKVRGIKAFEFWGFTPRVIGAIMSYINNNK